MPVDVNFVVGGEAGQGVQSVGFLLAKVFARAGYHVFADQDYESRIRGGHNFFRVRVKDSRVGAVAEAVHVLIALNGESIALHREEVTDDGIVIFDGDKLKEVEGGGQMFPVPLERVAVEKGDKLMANTVALGAALGMVRGDFPIVERLLKEHFGRSALADSNVTACRAGYDYAQSQFKGAFGLRLPPVSDTRRMLLTGNEAIALAAIASGCKFMAAYPMTPTTSIMEFMAARDKDFDLVVVQPEDEIAAINMAVGAAYAGVRAMTATSGSGFCLMTEGIGLASITETPIVVVDGQRAGPAVGLPTRTEQGDLQFVLHAHHGDFPRAVLAPASVADCFWATARAFNLAEKYQLPVIILTDQHLASSYATVEPFELSAVSIDRGLLWPVGNGDPSQYKRHQVTESGISPRAFPGLGPALVVTDADEHDEQGHLTEDAGTRTAQVQKRLRKLSGLKKEINPPALYGPRGAETTLIGWGSTEGALCEAVDMLKAEGKNVNLLHLNDLWPFPAEAVAEALGQTRKSCVVENNASGQLARLIRAETGIQVNGTILKFDGRPFTPAYIAQTLKKEMVTHGQFV